MSVSLPFRAATDWNSPYLLYILALDFRDTVDLDFHHTTR